RGRDVPEKFNVLGFPGARVRKDRLRDFSRLLWVGRSRIFAVHKTLISCGIGIVVLYRSCRRCLGGSAFFFLEWWRERISRFGPWTRIADVVRSATVSGSKVS